MVFCTLYLFSGKKNKDDFVVYLELEHCGILLRGEDSAYAAAPTYLLEPNKIQSLPKGNYHKIFPASSSNIA